MENNKIKGTIFAIDFDGTCVAHEFPNIGRDIGAQKVLKRIVSNGGKLILYTMRSEGYLDDAVEWFRKNEIELYAIQKNPTQHIWTDSPKCYAKIYIDDAALGCPLKNGRLGEQRHVDWKAVEEILFEDSKQ